MQQKDVIIGHEYNIKMEGGLVRVKVIADRGYSIGHVRQYRVQRVDSGKVLPKYRTCQALYPLQKSETSHD
jgi:hypothetical protein